MGGQRDRGAGAGGQMRLSEGEQTKSVKFVHTFC